MTVDAGDVRLRAVVDSDLDVLFEHQADPEATAMAAFPARDRERFDAHWARIRRDETVILRTILAGDRVAGGITSWPDEGRRLVGYWLGREYWGRGVATRALALFLAEVSARPLFAHVAAHNAGSIRVLRKCGFQPDPAQEDRSAGEVEEFVFVLT